MEENQGVGICFIEGNFSKMNSMAARSKNGNDFVVSGGERIVLIDFCNSSGLSRR